ncbi:hypothetical protein R1flu_022324 [Riccia fluitans]|uniref:BTB domain-containing protein n=1 Tax=Riccia fluitans TaxID=41844 RepID=A0ABD1ZRV3_9MARC
MEQKMLSYNNAGACLKFQKEHCHSEVSQTVGTAVANQYENLMTALRDENSCVVFLCEGNERVLAVRALLCAGCEVIRKMLKSGSAESRAKEVSLPEVSSVGLRIIIDFVCYEKFNLHKYDDTELEQKWTKGLHTIKAAKFLLLGEVETVVWRTLLCDLYHMIAFKNKVTSFTAKWKILSVVNDFMSSYEIPECMCNTLDGISSLLCSTIRRQWLDTYELQFLPKDRMKSWLEIVRGGDKVVTRKIRIDVYLRLRQVLLWCVSNGCFFSWEEHERQTENVIDSYFPSGTNVLRFIQSNIDGVPVELDSFLKFHKKVGVSVLQEACFRMRFEENFAHLLDLHLLHPVILMEILEPLQIVSLQCILAALKDDTSMLNHYRVIRENSVILPWLLSPSFNRCAGGTTVEKLGFEKGDAIALTPMIVSSEVDCAYRWELILEHSLNADKVKDYEQCLGHGWENGWGVGFVKGEGWTSGGYQSNDMDFDDKSLYTVSDLLLYKTARFQGTRIKVQFKLDRLVAKGSICLNRDHRETVRSWNSVPEGMYYPYICFHPPHHETDFPPLKKAKAIRSVMTAPDLRLHSKTGMCNKLITKIHIKLVSGFNVKWI